MFEALFGGRQKTTMVSPDQALPGQAAPWYRIPERHEVLGTPLQGPFPAGLETAIFGLGCFWGAEQIYWQLPGVYTTSVGYAGGYTPHPSYEEVCSAKTGHAEVVQVVFDPKRISYDDLLRVFWESHNPTEGMRQGNDVGTQYRSGIYFTTPEQQQVAEDLAGNGLLVGRDRQATLGDVEDPGRGAAVVGRVVQHPVDEPVAAQQG